MRAKCATRCRVGRVELPMPLKNRYSYDEPHRLDIEVQDLEFSLLDFRFALI